MKKTILALSLFILGWTAPLSAEVMTYQGRLKESNVPVNANRSFLFELCATETPTGCVASADGAKPFAVQNGLFKSTFTLPAVDLSAGPWYLRVKVEGSYLSPVERLTFVPYSAFASSAAYAGSASALAAVSGTGVISSTHVIVLGGLNASDAGVQLSTVAVIEGYALLKNINTGIEDVRVGVSGRVNSDSTDAVDILAGGNFEVEVPVARNGNMIGVRSSMRNAGSSALAVGLLVDSLSNSGTIGDTYGVWIATLTQGGQTNKPFALYAEDPNARSYFAGNVGISSRAPAYALSVSSASGDLFWVADDGAHGAKFWGDGSGLTGVTGASGTDSTKLLKAGDTMTGSLLMDAGSTITVTGSAFSVGGSTLVVKNGYVGIGTDSPANPLQVLTASQYVFAANSTSSNATINLVHSPGGVSRINDNSGNGAVALSVGHVNHLLVNDRGNVGISSATPAYRLVVSSGAGETGLIMAVSTGATNVFSVDGYGVTALKFTGDGSGLTGLTAGAAGTAGTATNLAGGAQGEIPYQTGVSNTAMLAAGVSGQLLASGGAGTPSWTSAPSITGGNITGVPAGSIAAGSLLNTVIASSIAVNSVYDSAMVSPKVNRGGDTMTGYLDIVGATLRVISDPLVNYSFAAGTGTMASHLFVSTTGNVGVGTVSPATLLDVNGQLSIAAGTYANPALKFRGFGSGFFYDAASDRIEFLGSAGTSLQIYPGQLLVKRGSRSAPGVAWSDNTGTGIYGPTGSDFGIVTAGQDRLRIDAAGNVGLSTGLPQGRLDVLAAGSAQTDMAQIWRNSAGVIVSSVSATGVVAAIKFVGDGSGITGLGSAAAAGTATNLAGGVQGEIPYQSGVGATAMLGAGVAGQLLQSGGGGGAPSWATPSSANTPSTIVKRDASGDFSAGMITANVTGSLTGNADTVTNGVYDSTTYSDPVWIASLATSKINLSTVTADIGLRVLRGGDTMSGQLTNTSSVTITGNGGGPYGLQVSSNISLAGSLYSANGMVGIGTASPAAKLDVYGPNTAAFIEVHNTSNSGKKTLRVGLWSNHGLLDVLDASESTAIRLNADPTGPSFFNAGNVGIGSVAPDQKLTVAGSISQTGVLISSGTGDNYFAGRVGIGIQTVGPQLEVLSESDTLGALGIGIRSSNNANRWGFRNDFNNGNFHIDGYNSGWADRLTILKSNGNVGIGTTAPDQKLTVAGNISQTGMLISSGTGLNYFAGDVTAARYQVGGSTVLAVLPGLSSLGVGLDAGPANTGDGNLFVGIGAGKSNDSGFSNSFLGTEAGYTNTTGQANSFVGYYAGRANNFGGGNTFVGNQAGLSNDGDNNTFFGANAGTTNSAGDNNVFIGAQAGFNATGTNNIVIGYNKDTSQPIANDELNIGGVLYGDLSARTIGISTRVPQAALDIVSTGTVQTQFAQIWRDSNGNIQSSMSVTGVMMASRFVGNGSGLTAVSGSDATKLPLAGGSLSGQLSVLANTGATAADIITNGISVSTGGAIQTTGIGHGTVSGDPRGLGAVDLQTLRLVNTDVASGKYAVIAGGNWNSAAGNLSAVGGGLNNHADAVYAVVPGGSYNSATGAYSFAAGYAAKASVQGAFTWSDSEGNYTDNSVQDRTVFKNRGGFMVTGSTVPVLQGTVNRGVMITGAGLVGISTGSPQAALDVVSTGTLANQYAQIWRNSGGAVVASMTATGRLSGDGSGLTGVSAIDSTKLPLTGGTLSSGLTIGGSTLAVRGPGDLVYLNSANDWGTVYISEGVAPRAQLGYARGTTIFSNGEIATAGFMNGNSALQLGANSLMALTLSSTGKTGVGFNNPLYALDISTVNLTDVYIFRSGVDGIVISTGGAIQTTGSGHGSVAGNPRGKGAVDLQTNRNAGTQVASGEYSVIGGGSGNTAINSRATVSGGGFNTANGPDSTVGGGTMNQATNTNATVAGGLSNIASIYAAAVGGGAYNTSAANYAVISGGFTNSVTGENSAISGGAYNVVSGSNSFTGGGLYNIVRATSSVVAGGERNKAVGFFSTIGGGNANTATGNRASVLGGQANTASGDYSAVAGGQDNTASSYAAAVAGGWLNSASNNYAAVSGGISNAAIGFAATVSGGRANTASGDNSFIGGGGIDGAGAGGSNNAMGKFSVLTGGSFNLVSGSNSVVSGGLYNVAAGTTSVIAGGENNRTENFWSAVGGGRNNTARDIYATVAGGYGNYAGSMASTIGGGSTNNANNSLTTIGGGQFHTIDAMYGTVAGGKNNKILSLAQAGFIGGGDNNISTGAYSTVGGGRVNSSSGAYSAVLGGYGNAAEGPYSVVAGGNTNRAYGAGSVVSGGKLNNAWGDYSTVAGGQSNEANTTDSIVAGGSFNSASGLYSAVVGGNLNKASGTAAFIGAGGSNQAKGWGAVAFGGNNAAMGGFSFAAGYRSTSSVDGTFTWSDSQGFDVVNNIQDQVMFKAKGGFWVSTGTVFTDPGLYLHPLNNVGIGDINPDQKLAVNGGVRIADTGVASTGTIRFNIASGNHFQGNNGTGWVNFDVSGGGWTSSGGTIYPGTLTDNVGIGIVPTGHKLQVLDSNTAIAQHGIYSRIYPGAGLPTTGYGFAYSKSAVAAVADSNGAVTKVFGVAGYLNSSSQTDSAGVFGAVDLGSGGNPASWGALGYRDAGSSEWAGYFKGKVKADPFLTANIGGPYSVLYLGGNANFKTGTDWRGIYIESPADATGFTNRYALVTSPTAGNVGIGVTNPSVQFHNAGPAILANNTTIDPDTYANSVIAGYVVDGGFNATGVGGMATNAGSTWGIGHNNADLVFAVGDGTNPNTLQTFMQATWKRNLALVPVSGRVGVGLAAATVPDQKLTVIGNISQTGVLISSGAGDNYFAGNVGIGTQTPASKLEVNGDLGLGAAGADSNQPIVIWLNANIGVNPGDVVIAGPGDNQFNTTNTPNHTAVIGVALNSVAMSTWGKIAVGGVVTVNCSAGTAGQHALTSATPGQVTGNVTPPAGASVGIYLTNCGVPAANKARILLK